MQQLTASLQPCLCTASATAASPAICLSSHSPGKRKGEYIALGWMTVPPMMISPQPPLARSS